MAAPKPTPHEVQEPGLNIQYVATEQVAWFDIPKPAQREMDYLGRRYGFNAFDLEDCLSRVERPKLDRYPQYLFLVLHFPVFRRQARVTVLSQVAIFIGEGYLITVHSGDLAPLTKLFEECQTNDLARREHMGRTSSYLLYRILDRLVDYLFPIMNKVASNIEQVEDSVFSEFPRGAVRELAILRRDIIALRRIVRHQIPVIDSLERFELLFPKEELEVHFGDIGDHIRKVWDSLEDYHQVVEVLSDTNNSLTSHRLNQVMRMLTIISTTMLPLTVVASIYGMNFERLPLEGSAVGFPLLMGIMVLIAAGMLYLFRRMRWL